MARADCEAFGLFRANVEQDNAHGYKRPENFITYTRYTSDFFASVIITDEFAFAI